MDNNRAIRLSYPSGKTKTWTCNTLDNGWNLLTASLKEDLGFTDETLVDVYDIVKFTMRSSNPDGYIYFDEFRLLQLEE